LIQDGLGCVPGRVRDVHFVVNRFDHRVLDRNGRLLLVNLGRKGGDDLELGRPGVYTRFAPRAPVRRWRCESVGIRKTSFKIC